MEGHYITMLKAADMMAKDVATIRGSATVAEAMKLIGAGAWRALIVDRQHEQDAYGIVTETDILYKVMATGKDPRAVRVYQIMTKPCIVVNPNLGIHYVARLFAANGLRIAPVIQGQLLGIISESDLLKQSDFLENPPQVVLAQSLEEAIAHARNLCEQEGPTSPACLDAWKRADALETEAAFQQSTDLAKTALETFVEEYPETQSLLYDNWCSG